ncbi:MAG: nickel-dependent hydrogenase large subunit [Candidatus Lokiarchaeota archaeon]|nr:nickel-dependent hydrogenase large subunit [Candidatus Lokiarchaeota archaeon]
MQKIVEPCKRIENNGNIKILLKGTNIDHVEFELPEIRGFENILIKKKVHDIPRIASRICGLCHASQAIVSNKVIEDMYGITPPSQSIILRRILLIGELIKSHIMHYFFQSFPDLLKIINFYEISNPYELMQFDPQLTSSVFDLIKLGSEIDKIFGGRYVHLITCISGGVIYKPSQLNINLIRKLLQKGSSHAKYLIGNFIKLFSTKTPPISFDLPKINYLGLSNHGFYDRYKGKIVIKNYKNQLYFSEKDYQSYFNKDIGIFGVTFHQNNNIGLITGPIAREKINQISVIERIAPYFKTINENWNNSILFQNFLELIEVDHEIHQCLKLLNDDSLNKCYDLPDLGEIQKSEGIGVVEAPRGLLMHHYKIDQNESVIQAKLFIATEINIPLMNFMTLQYARNLYKKEAIDKVKKKIAQMIRAFDPCISCATH